MLRFLATGHPWYGVRGHMTPVPLMGLLLSLILIRFVCRLRLGAGALIASVALGTLFSSATDAWGLTVSLAIWVLGALTLTVSVGRTREAFGGSPPD